VERKQHSIKADSALTVECGPTIFEQLMDIQVEMAKSMDLPVDP
jgi:hypothetical protein